MEKLNPEPWLAVALLTALAASLAFEAAPLAALSTAPAALLAAAFALSAVDVDPPPQPAGAVTARPAPRTSAAPWCVW